MRLRDRQCFRDLFLRDVHPLGDLFDGRLASSSWSSDAERLPMRCSVPARFSGTRTMRDCSASAWRIAWRIHHTA